MTLVVVGTAVVCLWVGWVVRGIVDDVIADLQRMRPGCEPR